MSILGFDYGNKVTGVAISDISLTFAFSLCTIREKYSCCFKQLDVYLLKIMQEHKIKKIVIGFPKQLNNVAGEQCSKTLIFKQHLEELFKLHNIEIVMWDERVSTLIAQRTLSELGLKTRKQKKIIDAVSAAFILQGYLDYLKNIGEISNGL
jgi:putative Holliday junction resolvase